MSELTPQKRLALEGACAGAERPDDWFPEDGNRATRESRQRTAQALAACAACPVRELCLTINMEEEYGIFGGLTQRDRRELRRSVLPHRKNGAKPFKPTHSPADDRVVYRRLLDSLGNKNYDAMQVFADRHEVTLRTVERWMVKVEETNGWTYKRTLTEFRRDMRAA